MATNVPTLQNVTMIVENTSTVVIGGDPTGTGWTDGTTSYTVTSWTDEFGDGFHQGDVLVLTDGNTWHTWTIDSLSGTSTIALSLWHGQYVFNIRTSPTIYFYDDTGATVGTFTVTDAAYSLQRYLVMDPPGQPIWMYDKPLFDLTDHTSFNSNTAMNLAHMIKDAIVPNTIANTLTINTGCHFPDNAFMQVLANIFGCIGSKNNTIAIGGWDGNLFSTSKYGGPYPDWWIDWAGQGHGIAYSSLDPSDQVVPSSYVGTGPYHIVTIDPVGNPTASPPIPPHVILQWNPSFWMGWPATFDGTVANGQLNTVEIDYITSWPTRKTDFLAGSIDACAVSRANMFDLLNNATGNPIIDPAMKTITQIAPVLTFDAYMFTFLINGTSPYVGTGSFPNGIPLDFFNNTHTRKAFAYSFNITQYAQQVLNGESEYRKNWLTDGLYPDYYNDSIPGYDVNYTAAMNELKQAVVGGQNVWNSGFTFDLTYWTQLGKAVCTMISNFFQTLSTYAGRTGPPFTINVTGISYGQTLQGASQELLPMFDVIWSADFADADDFTQPYMYGVSGYGFAYNQGYTAANGWGSLKDNLIDKAVLTPDGPARQALYQQLALIYYNDCPSFPVNNALVRRWCWYWVKGWYYNAMYPGSFYYTMWKANNCWFNVAGVPTKVSSGRTNMRDIAYLVMNFGAKAPDPSRAPDPRWVGWYGANGCVDPYGDRVCNMKDIAACVQHFGHTARS